MWNRKVFLSIKRPQRINYMQGIKFTHLFYSSHCWSSNLLQGEVRENLFYLMLSRSVLRVQQPARDDFSSWYLNRRGRKLAFLTTMNWPFPWR